METSETNPKPRDSNNGSSDFVPNCTKCCSGVPGSAGWKLGLVLNPKRLDFGWLLAPAAAGGKASMTARPNTNDLRFNDMPPSPNNLDGGMVPYIELLACSDGEGLRHLELPSLKSPSYHRRNLGV